MSEQKIICVVGGSGFVGRHVVRALVARGYLVKVIGRSPFAAEDLKTMGELGQVAFAEGDVVQPKSVARHFAGAHAVVNLTGILFEKGKQRFIPIHAHAPEHLAKAAKAAGAEIFIQMSALGVDRASASAYASNKMMGEKVVRSIFPNATVIRPSVIFGPEDNFFNQFAGLAEKLPALPLIGGGETKFQPVYVGDVADVIIQSIEQPARAAGQRFELGGPRVMTFKEVLEYILEVTGQKACLVKVPFGLARFQARFAELLPTPPITRDQVTLLKYDNVLSGEFPTMEALGVTATSVDSVVPEYLEHYKKRKAGL